jgi:hypothetical protein
VCGDRERFRGRRRVFGQISAELHFDQLVRVERAVDLFDHRFGHALEPDLNYRLELVGERLQGLLLRAG